MSVEFRIHGASRSFPSPPPAMSGNGLVLAGTAAPNHYRGKIEGDPDFIAVELGTECLGEHTGADAADEHVATVGFARFRLGSAEPTNLVEIVHHPWTDPAALRAARTAFESAGYVTAACEDFPGRIVDRLIRPYLNAVLRRLDEKLATATDLDRTLRLGLGYPVGPVELLQQTGLEDHFRITNALYEATGDPDLAPARRARIAACRAERS
jgi:3-hydroxybutyryl-CoA dehydrogenase